MPAVSQAQRAYLAAHFGPAWLHAHHFDNRGPLPAHVHQEKPVSSILSSILGQAGSAGHGLPPDIQAAIGGGQQGSEHQAVPLLKQAISLLHQYQQVEPDEADKQTVMKCLAQLQSVLVKDQQEADGAMQGQTTPRMVRKAAAAQGAGNGGY